MKCPNCNFEVAENAKFCPECGTKIPEVVKEETPSKSAEDAANAPAADKLNDQKKAKSKNIKKALIISGCGLLVCGIAFLILYLLNPGCMFGHREVHHELGVESTCSQPGSYYVFCNDCGEQCGGYMKEKLPHDYGTVVCGVEITCINCGYATTFEHQEDYTSANKACKNCGKSKISISIPSVPVTVHEYDYSNDIEQSCIITKIETSPYLSDVATITYTVKRTYHEKGSNYSASAKFGWKLYDSDGTVVDSGTEYSDGNIKVGEQSQGSFNVYNLTPWEEYRLEILNLS